MMSRHAARLFCALGVALFTMVPRTSSAQDDATIEMARQRFREGVQYYDQHQFEKARLAFLQAYALKPHPSVLLNLAQSELRSGHPDDAALHFSQYLRINTSASDADRQETTLGYNTAKSRVGEVALSVDPAGATVAVDGSEKGVAPLPDSLYLLPGSHTIEARSNDRHVSKTVTLGAGQSVTVQLTVHGSIAAAGVPGPAESPAPSTEATGESTEGETANEPLPEKVEPLPPVAVETVSTEGKQGVVDWFVNTPPAWIVAGVGVVGLGLGATMGLVSNHEYSVANNFENQILHNWGDVVQDNKKTDKSSFPDDIKPCSLPPYAKTAIGAAEVNKYASACTQYSSHKNTAETDRTVAILSTAIGGAALVGTVIYYFADRGPEKAGSAKAHPPTFRANVVPMTGGGITGIGVLGTF